MKGKIFSALAAVGVAIALTGGGVMLLSDGASATADGTTYASVTSLEGESQNGQVDGITVTSTGLVEWENMPDDVDRVEVTMSTNAGENGSYQTFANETFENVSSNDSDGEYSYDEVSGDVLANTDFDSETFSADDDGETQKRYFPVKVTVTVVGEDGTTCEFEETHKVKTEVTNLHDPKIGGESEVGGHIDMNNSQDGHCPTC